MTTVSSVSEIREKLLKLLEDDPETNVLSLYYVVEDYKSKKGLGSVHLGLLALDIAAKLQSLVMHNEAAPGTIALYRNLVRKLDELTGENSSRLLEEFFKKHESRRKSNRTA